MSRERTLRKSSAPAAAVPAAAARLFAPPAWAVVGMLVALTLIVQRHTLHSYFALDDFIMFQQAAGIRPWPHTVWRWLSGWAWFRAVVPLWGHEPFPYHAASLALHALNSLLLYRLAPPPGASPGAAGGGARGRARRAWGRGSSRLRDFPFRHCSPPRRSASCCRSRARSRHCCSWVPARAWRSPSPRSRSRSRPRRA